MRRISRLDRSIDLLRPRLTTSLSTPFLCAACRGHSSSFSTSVRRDARKSSLPRTERLRRRIWGTDEPPGMEDPYGGPSIVEQRQAAKGIEHREEIKELHPELGSPSTATLDPNYEPATSWDGLVEVGGEQVEEFYFEGFIPARTVSDPLEATAAVRRAVVEVFAAKQSGRPFSDLSSIGRANDRTLEVRISGSPEAPILEFKNGMSEKSILTPMAESGTESDSAPDIVVEQSESLPYINYEKQVTTWDPAWLQISLENSEIKFAVIKRVMQLSGIRIPDSTIQSVHTLKSLINHLIIPPKPTKLAEALTQSGQLISLPNVKVFGRRITPIDKEVSVGRWKLIEKELSKRGLPVTGH